MNTAARVAVRVGMDRGHTMLGVRDGFRGLAGGADRRARLDVGQRLGVAAGCRAGHRSVRSPTRRRCHALAAELAAIVSMAC